MAEPVAVSGDFGVAEDGVMNEFGDGVVPVFIFGGGEEGATGADVLDGFFVRFAESAEGGGGGVVDGVLKLVGVENRFLGGAEEGFIVRGKKRFCEPRVGVGS